MGQLSTETTEVTGPARRSLKKTIAGIGFLCLLWFFLVRYIVANLESFFRLYEVCLEHLWFIVFSGLIIIILKALSGFQFNALMRHLGRDLPAWEWFGLAVVTHFFNLIMPFRGGMAARAWYLKHKYNFSYSHFLAIQGGFQAIVLISGAVMGLVGMCGVAFVRPGVLEAPLFIPVAVCFVLSAAVLFVLLHLTPQLKEDEKKGKWLTRLWKVVDGWRRIRTKRRQVVVIFLISLGQRLVKAVFWMVIFYCLGVRLGLFAGFFLAAVGVFSVVIMILPGNLGVDDAVHVFAATLIGVPLDVSIAAALLARMVNMGSALILGPLYNYILFKRRSI